MTMMLNGMNALMEANQQARQIPFYSEIMTNRPAKKHRIFEIGTTKEMPIYAVEAWNQLYLPIVF